MGASLYDVICVAEGNVLRNVRQIWLAFSLQIERYLEVKCKGLFMCDINYSPSHSFASGSYCAKFQK